MTSLILSRCLANDKQHKKAIETFNHLYQDQTYIFPTLIAQRIGEQLVLLKRKDEALTIINHALKNEGSTVNYF